MVRNALSRSGRIHVTDKYCVHGEVSWIFNYGAAAGEDELRILVFDLLFGERDFPVFDLLFGE